jgi:hypothetical protein
VVRFNARALWYGWLVAILGAGGSCSPPTTGRGRGGPCCALKLKRSDDAGGLVITATETTRSKLRYHSAPRRKPQAKGVYGTGAVYSVSSAWTGAGTCGHGRVFFLEVHCCALTPARAATIMP